MHSVVFVRVFRRFKFSPPFFQDEHAITNLALAEGAKPHVDLIVYATTESTVRSFRLLPTTPQASSQSSMGLSSAAALAVSVSTSLTSTLRDRRPFQSSAQQQQIAQFNIYELEQRMGCSPGCAVLKPPELDDERQFVIVNSTGVFSYVGDDRRLALAIDGEKLSVHWWFNYLITVSKETRKVNLLAPSITTTVNSSSTTNINKPQSNILSQLTAR
jgi:hypothetical protein